MPNIWTSDQINEIVSIQGMPSPGLLGAPKFPRATEVRGILKVWRFSVNNGVPHNFPGDPNLDPPAIDDSVVIALLNPTDRIYAIVITAEGGGTTDVTFGKIDPNNPANTDLFHYSGNISLDGTLFLPFLVPGNAGTFNMGEQVGADPQGDLSVGNTPPAFGSEKIQIVATFSGSDPSGTFFNGFVVFVEEGN